MGSRYNLDFSDRIISYMRINTGMISRLSKWNSTRSQRRLGHYLREPEKCTSEDLDSVLHHIMSTDERYLSAQTGRYYGVSEHLISKDNYPVNEALIKLAAGLAEGWKAYGNEDAAVLFVAQDGERNVFDQRWLEYELYEK